MVTWRDTSLLLPAVSPDNAKYEGATGGKRDSSEAEQQGKLYEMYCVEK